MIKTLTCIECPIGCSMQVTVENGKVLSIEGNTCPRGKMYAEAEMIAPKRVITSTVRTEKGTLVPVKTDNPVPKQEIFEIVEKLKTVVCPLPVKIGDVLVENISNGVNLIATSNER